MKYAALGDTVYFWFASNLTTGSAGDGATPTFSVRKAGASSSAAPTLTGTPTLLSHASYSDGSYEIAVAATEGNGFVADAEYAVFCSLAISGVNPNGFVGSVLLSTDAPSVFKSTDRDTLASIQINGVPATSLGAIAQTQIKNAVDAQLSGTHGSGSWESGGAGSGARTVTITVTDGTDPLENAKVRMTNGAESYLVETDVNGEAEFALDNATWSVAITKSGYQFTPTTLAVSGDTTHTYSLTLISVTPSDPGFVTGYLECYDQSGAAESGVVISLALSSPPTGTGSALDNAVVTATSNGSGLVEFTGLAPGAKYRIWRGSSTQNAVTFTVPSGAGPVALKNLMGKE
ncbi:MAG: hypothetical protein U0872_15440 [Planctomycetaceae bacterium]